MGVLDLKSTRPRTFLLAFAIFIFVACSSRASPIENLTEANFKALLSKDDIEDSLTSGAELEGTIRDYRDLALTADPKQVASIEGWYGATYTTESGERGITFTVMDFESQIAAQSQFEQMSGGSKEEVGFNLMTNPIGSTSFEITDGANGVGPLVVFRKNDKLVVFHVSQPIGDEPLISADGIRSLARRVEQKLK